MLETLLNYCNTKRQTQIMNAVINANGNKAEAARDLNCTSSTVRDSVLAVKRRAAKSGYSPEHDMTHEAPPGFQVKGTSTLYGADGEVKTQWVKTDVTKEDIAKQMKAVSDAFITDLPNANPVKHSGTECYSELLNQYTITDFHIGMLAWSVETGDDWDTDIAEQTLIDWFSTAIELSPNAEAAIFAQLGDYLHFDGLDSVTPLSGHVLDADTRYQKLIRVSINVTRKVIQMLLEKHKTVHVLMAEGNHDLSGSAWLREWLNVYYENESRVTIDTSANPYYAYEHGETALFYHHGHKKNIKNVDAVFAAQFREIFGRTKHAFAHMGHYHHNHVIESNLMQIEQHRTLAGADAYAARGGWISGRDAKVITYHKKYGEVSRLTISPDLINSRKS